MKILQKIFLLALFIFPSIAKAQTVTYHDGDVELEGYWVPADCQIQVTKPTVLIIHQWMGVTENEKMRANMLAKECYNAFVVDMYGKGVRPANTDEAGKLATQYKSDSGLARKRITAALDYVLKQPDVDADKIAVFGYCFGGTMALELARTGAPVQGVVSFHGGLSTPAPVTQPGIIKAAVRAHHGADDPLVPPAEVQIFEEEMKTAQADWTLTPYPGAVHSFTQKEAGDDPSKGVAYNEEADKKSWTNALEFLKEIFAK